ncbi:MAG: VCBS repeat-containing protein, partial [Planctomycetales bacterium]|nr:VCBS repeat-containing protein [Planctomycetales bacterium]
MPRKNSPGANLRTSAKRRTLLNRRPTLQALEGRRMLAGMFPGEGGTGTFVETALGSATAAALGDLDGDGDLDVLSISGRDATTRLNDGNGAFATAWQLEILPSATVGNSPASDVELADVDSDGDLDFLVATSVGARVWFNDGAGNFSDSGQQLGSSATTAIVVGDLDGDDDPDVLIGQSQAATAVWLNTSGVFAQDSSLADSALSEGALGDFDQDGDLDFVGSYSSPAAYLYANQGSGSFSLVRAIAPRTAKNPVVGDLDNDGDLDLIFGENTSSGRTFLANNGSAVFSSAGPASTARLYVALGDFNGDGNLDVMHANSDGLAFGDGTGGFELQGTPVPSVQDAIRVGDLDGDGDLDALLVDSSGSLRTWMNVDALLSIDITSPGGASIPFGETATFDVTISNESGGDVSGALLDIVPLGSYDAWALVDVVSSAGASSSLTLGDLGDFHDVVDLPAGGSLVYTVELAQPYVGDAFVALDKTVGVSARLSPAAASSGEPNSVFAIRQQVISLGRSQQGNTLYVGAQSFTPSPTRDAVLGDLDGDGDLDAFFAMAESPHEVWFSDGRGRFADSGQRLFSDLPLLGGDTRQGDAALGDVDGDGDLD